MTGINMTIRKRNSMLIIGVFSMLFAGIIYAWSILKSPLTVGLGLESSALALNFTLTMCFFCLGGLFGSFIWKRIGVSLSVILGGAVAGMGFVFSGLLPHGAGRMLYLSYALMAGGGIGIVYNVMISSISAWFPDKKGLCSGSLMMGFGASTLILGNLASKMFSLPSLGWRRTYIIFGIAIALVLSLGGMFVRRPGEEDTLPHAEVKKSSKESFEPRDLAPKEMIKRKSFWLAFIHLICLTAVGSSVISFARDLALSVNAKAELATTLVGVLAVCNGLGRIITGKCFDTLGRKKTMLFANLITLVSAATILMSVSIGSLAICIVGLCLTGISYGTSPTVSSAFTSSFYGTKHFPTNFSIMNCNLLFASFVATACSELLKVSGGYTLPFVFLLGLSGLSFILNLMIKKP